MREKKIKKDITVLFLIVFLVVFVLYGKNLFSESFLNGHTEKEGDYLKKSEVFEKINRTYLVRLPSDYDGIEPVPLVFVLHGAGGNAEILMRVSGMNEVADKEGFVVVYPNGTGMFSDFLLSWNVGGCCNYISTANVNDVGFINFLIDKLSGEYNIDTKRIYIAGMSNGGMMAYKLACELADKIAAIGPVSASMFLDECNPSEPVSVVVFHDIVDEIIPFFGGESSDFLIKFFNLKHKSVLESVYFWADSNNCHKQLEEVMSHIVYRNLFSDCDNGTEVLFYASGAGGHSWPGGEKTWLLGDEPLEGVSASRIIWDFFAAHPKK